MIINDDSITIMNHKISFDEINDILNYKSKIALCDANNRVLFNNMYDNNIIEKIADVTLTKQNNNPIFKIIKTFYSENTQQYNIKIYMDRSTRCEIPLKDFIDINDKIDFYSDKWRNIIYHSDPLFTTLKFKIKEEKITRNLRNDFNNLCKNQNKFNIKLKNELNDNILDITCGFHNILQNIIKEQKNINNNLKNIIKNNNSFTNELNNLRQIIKHQDLKIKYQYILFIIYLFITFFNSLKYLINFLN